MRVCKEPLPSDKLRLRFQYTLSGLSEDVHEVGGLRSENDQLKQLVAELNLKNRLLKKSLTGLE